MASRDYVETLINGLPADLQPAMKEIFTEVLRNLAFGHAIGGAKAENFTGPFLQGKTAAVANAEFKIVHGMDAPPVVAIPFLPLNAVNAVLPQLKVTRVADATYVYLSSPVTNATFLLYVEA